MESHSSNCYQQPLPFSMKGFKKPAKPATAGNIPSSIYVVQKFGVPLSYMRYALSNIWNIHTAHGLQSKMLPAIQPTDVVTAYLVQWDTSYALKQAAKGFITRDGLDYVVIYHGCTRRGLAIYSKTLLSFRVAAAGYDTVPTVLIKPYYQTDVHATFTQEIGE